MFEFVAVLAEALQIADVVRPILRSWHDVVGVHPGKRNPLPTRCASSARQLEHAPPFLGLDTLVASTDALPEIFNNPLDVTDHRAPFASSLFSCAGLARYGIGFLILLGYSFRVLKVPALTGQEPQIRRQDSQHQHFDVVHHCGILDRIPTEVIPEMFASFASTSFLNPRPDIPFSSVHRH
jgi:hypothetical protein